MTTTLYKLTDSSLLSWSITCDEHKVVIEHGQYTGTKQVDIHNTASPALAKTEMDRRIHIKVTKQGYTESIPTTVPNLPMLASLYDPSKLPPLVYIQPKLDGYRCIGTRDSIQYRRSSQITSMPHITDALRSLPPGIRLDGELYCHGKNFQQHASIIKRDSHHKDYWQIRYHVFDIQTEGPFEDRLHFLTQIVLNLNSNFVTLVPSRLCALAQVPVLAQQLYPDYEGAIVRHPHGLYRYNHRSADMQKYKWSDTEEFQIVDIVAASTGRESQQAIFVCVCNNNSASTFRVRPAMSAEQRKAIYRDRSLFTGFWTRVTFEGYSTNGKPLKPRAEGLFRTKEDAHG